MMEAKEIYGKMCALFGEKTGFAVGDDAELSVRLYAAAAQLESLYGYCDWALNQSFPQTASGQYLDMHAGLRGLSRKQAAKAGGSIRFYLAAEAGEDTPVLAGTVCLTAGLVRFVTVEDGVIPAGEKSCTVAAEAEEEGPGGNAAAGAVTRMAQIPVGIAGCRNDAAFSGGREEEDDEALRSRILTSFCRLPNGANAAFYEERAMSHEGVAGVQVLPRNRGAGTVDVVISAHGGLPEESLVQAVQEDLQAVREIAVDVKALSPVEKQVDVKVTVWPEDGCTEEDAVSAARQAITAFFDGSLLGKAVYPARLGQAILATGKVKNYLISAPQETLAAEAGVLPTLGSLTVTEGL